MAKKTSTKKSAVKPAATPKDPVVVSEIRNLATGLAKINNLPDDLKVGRDKLGASIQRFADRVSRSYASAVKKSEKAKAKAKRDAAKVDRDAAKRAKKVAARDALKAKLAKMDAELKG